LRTAWLNHLAAKKKWVDYLALYTPQSSIRRQCNYLRALINNGQQEKAFKRVAPIWSYGGSRPDDCTPVFNAWRKAGKLTGKLVWKRIELSMQKGEVGLARYLRRYLPSSEKAWFDQWLRIHNHPEKLVKRAKLQGPDRLRKLILTHGIKRLARKNVTRAISAWNRLQQDNNFPDRLRRQAERAIALRMIHSRHKQGLEFLDKIRPHASDTMLHEKRIRTALSGQQWKLVNKWIKQLPQDLQASDEWRYWRARALGELGDPDAAKGQFQKIIGERSFYGFLAADRLQIDYDLNYQPLQVSRSTLKQLEKNQGLLRSREMFLLNRHTSGRREWRAATRDMNPEQLKGAAILANRWGLHDRSIVVLAEAGSWDDLKLRFPLAHRKRVDKRAREKNLESAWVFAVIRQESAFVQDAHSPAGALGLMQLMPRTARSTARKLKLGVTKKSRILQPDVNIRLGTAYLRGVLNELGQNRVLATAAYNAGPSRVRRWLPAKAIPADLWIATVPFEETRGYLKRVLAYTVIYEQRLGQKPGRLMDSMPPIQRRLRKTADITQTEQNKG
jgi:soluble lytic murein transglycosylase